ncbi:hypothetical protein PYCCODRAFT_1175202 [Trametes coccinea BRFM310]|uniref:Uncharacterized protein n=1 Tax=Trametes coccinea (strain BRFM310) TaxID=1353009 RepID=A0A1Y2IX73_TRAC3|nr:hypothetical protein PYCCODRAFT_1175202 [Trametes coccinea BRFM310]
MPPAHSLFSTLQRTTWRVSLPVKLWTRTALAEDRSSRRERALRARRRCHCSNFEGVGCVATVVHGCLAALDRGVAGNAIVSGMDMLEMRARCSFGLERHVRTSITLVRFIGDFGPLERRGTSSCPIAMGFFLSTGRHFRSYSARMTASRETCTPASIPSWSKSVTPVGAPTSTASHLTDILPEIKTCGRSCVRWERSDLRAEVRTV